MANIADCSIRIAVEDLPKVSRIIRKASENAESCYIVEAHYSPEFKADVQYKCVIKDPYVCGDPRPDQVAEAYRLVNKEKDEWEKIDVNEIPTKDAKCADGKTEKRLDLWYTSSKVLKWEEVFTTTSNEKWMMDVTEIYNMVKSWPRMTDIVWAELGNATLEIAFSAKWDFPVEIADALNMLALDENGDKLISWQGAMSEPGMECATDDLGTEDLGLCIDYEAICPDCYDTVEERIEKGKNAEDYTCPDCKDNKGNPVRCYGQSYVSSYITNDGKQWRKI